MNGRPPESFRWKRIGTLMRPERSHSSAGVSTGASISCAPKLPSSSRMTSAIFWWTRQPSGRNVQTPAMTWRMNPPRTSSLCDAASASPGASRRVGRKSCEARATTRGQRLVEWDQRGFGHRQRGRLCHLEARGPLHAAGDPRVDLVEELVDQDVRRDLLEHSAVRIDEADVAAAGDAEVGVTCLPRTVDGAAHDGYLERLRVGAQTLLDHARQVLNAHVVPAA